MNVCVVKNQEIGLTETFIRLQVDSLGARAIHGTPPRLMGGTRQLAPVALRLAGRMSGRFRGDEGRRRARTREYASLMKTARADVVLAQYGTTGAVVWEACQARGIPLVVHFHGYDISRTSVLDEYAEAYASMFSYASAVIAVSRAMRQALIAIGAPPDKVVVNPCSVDPDVFQVGSPDMAPPTFVAVGRLVAKKAPHLLILAFAGVHRAVPEARLRLIGDGELRGVVSDLIQALGLEQAVELVGPQPHHAVREAMQQARAFVQHSVVAADGDSEGTPVSVLEAAASGLPVISTDHAGIPDAVRDGATGYIVPERDVNRMADRMLEIAQDPALSRRLGRAGRRRVERLYSRPLRSGRLRDILQRAYQARPLERDLLQDPIDTEGEGEL